MHLQILKGLRRISEGCTKKVSFPHCLLIPNRNLRKILGLGFRLEQVEQGWGQIMLQSSVRTRTGKIVRVSQNEESVEPLWHEDQAYARTMGGLWNVFLKVR